MKNKLTLLIDGNWLLMSRLSKVKEKFDKTQCVPEEIERAKYTLLDLLAQSIHKLINTYPDIIDNVLLVQDAGSWRKDFPQPACVTDKYKGNREYDEDVTDWTAIWDTAEKFACALRSNNILCVRDWKIEGDDWIAHWSRKLNSEGINTMIWSTDRDLQQLVNMNRDTAAWTAWYNNKGGLILPKDCNEVDFDPVDFFLRYEEKDFVLDDLVNRTRQMGQPVEYIDAKNILFEKVLCGDSSDNIAPIIVVNGNTRRQGVTKRDIKTILENNYSIDEFFAHKNDIITILYNTKKLSATTRTLQDIDEAFEYNKTLVFLNDSVLPEHYKTSICQFDNDYKVCDIDYIKNNYKALLGEYNDINIKDTLQTLIEDLF
ncbi:MAG: hypothetical protein IIT65_08435 [Lachnospiraceae bacterium]|nr:hypothetical protein [Lachnospiraceae bacterium]